MQDEKREQGNAAGAAFPFCSTVRTPSALRRLRAGKRMRPLPAETPRRPATHPAFGPGFDYSVPPGVRDRRRSEATTRPQGRRKTTRAESHRRRSLRTGYDRKLRARDAATDAGTEQARRVSTRSGAHGHGNGPAGPYTAAQGRRRTTARPTLRPDNVRRRPLERP